MYAGDYGLEVVIVAVHDVDRSLAFYTEQVGFVLDVDYRPSGDFRVVQLTPPGSGCSVQLEVTGSRPETGARRYLVVADLDRARADLLARGVEVGPVRHKDPLDAWSGGWRPGTDPGRHDYASFADFTDPDGNVWVLQERGFHHLSTPADVAG
jgi:catechol 2,3-dioxygenase-like lactoylglutathione lyase family enzyme